MKHQREYLVPRKFLLAGLRAHLLVAFRPIFMPNYYYYAPKLELDHFTNMQTKL